MSLEKRVNNLEIALLHVIRSLDKLRIEMETQLEEDYEQSKKEHHDQEYVENRYNSSKKHLQQHSESLNMALDALEGINEHSE